MGEKFDYNYDAPSPKERQEIENIRSHYLPKSKELIKLERLKKLDSKVKNIPLILGLSFGVIGCLIFGVGLTFFLEWENVILGVIFGIIGVILMLLAYPIFNKYSDKLKDKYSDEIIKLSNELLNEDK